jgi:hypothetical protein
VALLTEYLVVFEGPAWPGSSAAIVEGDPMANSDRPNRRQFIVKSSGIAGSASVLIGLVSSAQSSGVGAIQIVGAAVDQTDWHE